MTTIKTQSKKAEVLERLSKAVFDAKRNTTPAKNLQRMGGIEVACYPLNHDAVTSNETLTIFNYEQLQALKDLVSLEGRYTVEIQYLGTEPAHEYRIFGLANDSIDMTVKLACEYPEVDVALISYLINEFAGGIDEVRDALNNADAIVWDVYPTHSTVEAFQDFVNDHDYVQIPQDLKSYINYERMMADYMDITAFQINDMTFIIDTWPLYNN